MTRTTLPLVAHVAAPAGSTPSPLTEALSGLPGQVLSFTDASQCLAGVPPHGEMVFLVERSAMPPGALMWLILLAESRRGPVILVEDDAQGGSTPDADSAMRAGVHCVVHAVDFARTASLQALVLDAFGEFERRAPAYAVEADQARRRSPAAPRTAPPHRRRRRRGARLPARCP